MWFAPRAWWRATRDVSIMAECVQSAPFTGDEELIRRLIINVLDNAIRYSPAGGAVRVALDRAGDVYAVSVSDQGPGIAAGGAAKNFRALLSRRHGPHARRRERRRCRPWPGAGALDCAGARTAISGSPPRRGWDRPSSSHCLSAPKPAPQSYFTEGVVSSISAFPLLFVVNVPTCFASMKTV